MLNMQLRSNDGHEKQSFDARTGRYGGNEKAFVCDTNDKIVSRSERAR